MSTIKSTKRIIDFLKQQENSVTPTTIHKKTKVGYDSVITSLQFLLDQKLIDYSTDGRINLISLKNNQVKGVSNEPNTRH